MDQGQHFEPVDFQYRSIMLKGSAYWLRVDRNPPPNNVLSAYLWDGVGYQGINSGPTYLQTGVIYHVACTYDGANIRVYVNGVQANSSPRVFSIPAGAAGFGIGQTTWDGTFDEVALYNKALSPEQILAHYRAGA